MQISKGSNSDSSNLLGRVSRIEMLLSKYQELEIDVSLPGRGLTRVDALVRPSMPVDEADAMAAAGAFFTMRTITDDADPSGDTGDIVLQGGNVGGGTGNVPVDDILLFDQSAGGGLGEWQGDPTDILELTITGVGIEADGVLLSGFNVSTAVAAPAVTIGANVVPVAGTLAGTLRISLGSFFLGGFSPSAAGDVNVTYCPGAFTPTRI